MGCQRRALLWCGAATLIASATAASAAPAPRDAFALANAAYGEAGRAPDDQHATAKYEQALQLYQSILDRGIENGTVYYNLGNACYRLGRIGEAIAAYRRAERYIPRNRYLQANLELARQQRRDRIERPAPHPLAAAFLFWYYAASLGELETAAALCYVLLFVLAGAWAVKGRRWLRTTTALALALALVTGAACAAKGWSSASRREAVVIDRAVKVMSEAHGRSQERFRLHEGAEVKLRRRREGWVEVELDEKRRGWVETRFLREI